jgi:hypothetical protein
MLCLLVLAALVAASIAAVSKWKVLIRLGADLLCWKPRNDPKHVQWDDIIERGGTED